MKQTILLALILCIRVSAQNLPYSKTLDKNKVVARINTTNDKFWNLYGNTGPAYEVPKGSKRHAMFANSIWLGGLDQGGALHLAASTYKQNGTDFWVGPLDTTNASAPNSTIMSQYNKVWKIDCDDINAFINAFNSGSVSAGTYTIPSDILTYPAIGYGNLQRQMAPFMDVNNDGLYNPLASGDYPIIQGQQQVLSIYNDNYKIHTESSSPNLGFEIHERSFAYSDSLINDSMQAINYTTFYLYTIYNRTPTRYSNFYITDWSDVDVGYYLNDYIGTDTINNFAYCYNDGPSDPTASGIYGYGSHPPVTSHALLPLDCSNDGIDNNNDGMIDEPGEQFKINKTTYYNNNIGSFLPQTTNPVIGVHYYNYMSGYWKDGSYFSAGGTAYGGTVQSNYVYPGDPENNTGWTESTAGNPSGDRRILFSSGPFTFPAYGKIEWGYAIVFSQDTTQAVNTISQFHQRVQRDVKNIKYYFMQNNTPLCTPAVTFTGTTGLTKITDSPLNLNIFPNPAHTWVTIELNANVTWATVQIKDLLGREIVQEKMTNTYRKQIDVSSLPEGIYLVNITSDKGDITQKIIRN